MERAERKAIERMLWEWGSALKDCERRRSEIRRLMEQAQDAECILKSQVMTGMPRGDGVGDPTARAVQMRDDALRRVDALTAEINDIMARKEKVDAVIGLLPERCRAMLDLRYKQGMRVGVEIPRKMHISERTAAYWMSETMEKFADFCRKFGVE